MRATGPGKMFVFAAVALLMLTIPCSEARLSISPVGARFAGPEHRVTFPGRLPRTSTGNSATSKLVGGEEAGQNEYPFVVQLHGLGGFCGGVLVDERWVLTSIGCNIYPTFAVLGDYDMDTDDGTEQVIDVAKVITEPGLYFNSTVLVKLAERAKTRDEAVSVAELVDTAGFMAKVLANERECVQLGWGYVLTANGTWTIPGKMQAASVTFVSDEEMLRRGYGGFVNQVMLGTEVNYADDCKNGGACFGDFGSPVVCKKGKSWVVAGLYAGYDRTDGCMTGVKATTNIYARYDWIQSIIA